MKRSVTSLIALISLSAILVACVWLFSKNTVTKEFNVLDIEVKSDNEIDVKLEGWKHSRLSFKVDYRKYLRLIPFLPVKNDDVIISVLNVDEGVYYIAIRDDGEIKKAKVKVKDDVKNKIAAAADESESMEINERREEYILYPLFFGGMKESFKDLEISDNTSLILYSLENELFKFDFVMNADYCMDYEDKQKGYGTKSEISELACDFKLVNVSVNEYEDAWIDLDADKISKTFDFKLRPELHVKANPTWMSVHLSHYRELEIYYDEGGELKKLNRAKNEETDNADCIIKSENAMDENEIVRYKLSNLSLEPINPKLKGRISTYGVDL